MGILYAINAPINPPIKRKNQNKNKSREKFPTDKKVTVIAIIIPNIPKKFLDVMFQEMTIPLMLK